MRYLPALLGIADGNGPINFTSPDILARSAIDLRKCFPSAGCLLSALIRIKYPNAYYTGLGSLYIEPHVNLKLCGTKKDYPFSTLKIDDGMPFRTLTYPAPPSKNPRSSAMFYVNDKITLRSQEQILRDSGYPRFNIKPVKMPDNFWGLKPPN